MAGDGVSGEYRPLPVDGEERHRSVGNGIAGLSLIDGELSRTRADQHAGFREGELATIHSWELVTAVDGPGSRLTVFFSGCPLRCQFCHNPDTMFAGKGSVVTLDDITARMMRYRGIFKATRGGLTLSGGEPLQQPKFVAKLLRRAKEQGIHTAIDTSGFLGANVTDEMLEDIDLVLLDLKSGLSDVYRDVTNVELAPTLAFGQRLAEHGIEIWIRFVCVPGLNDSVENVEAVATAAASLSTVSRVEVLPFHQMGRDKWESLGLEYQLKDTPTPTNDLVERVREQFRAHGLTTY